MTLMILECATPIPMPAGLVFIYPFLDFNITSWMTADHLRLLRQESTGDMGVMNSKRHHERRKSVLQTWPDAKERSIKPLPKTAAVSARDASLVHATKRHLGTRLAMTSRVSFFQDRIISPDMVFLLV